MIGIININKLSYTWIFILSFFLPPLSYAFSPASWHPMITIGAGTATSSTVGSSASFPIQNPLSDEFYYYSLNHRTQTSGLGQIFVGTERDLTNYSALQLGLDYTQAAPFAAQGTFLQGADTLSQNQYSYHYNVLAKQLLLASKLSYVIHEKFHPFVFLGVGSSFNKSFNYTTNVPPTLSFTRLYAGHTLTAFSYALGIGLDVNIMPAMRIGLSYRFADLGKTRLGQAMIDTQAVSGTFSQSHLYANEVLIQLTGILR